MKTFRVFVTTDNVTYVKAVNINCLHMHELMHTTTNYQQNKAQLKKFQHVGTALVEECTLKTMYANTERYKSQAPIANILKNRL